LRLSPSKMDRVAPVVALIGAFALGLFATEVRGQEWLTAAELVKLRDEQEPAKRTGIYMAAAKLRLEAVESRLAGKSSPPGDPLEFHSQAELVSGCRMAVRAAMLNIQDQVSYKKLRGPELSKSLADLKKSTQEFLPRLRAISQTAIERRDEPLYRATQECIDFADSAARGAEQAIEKYKSEAPKSKKTDPATKPPSR
jgi:hypothetical protein